MVTSKHSSIQGKNIQVEFYDRLQMCPANTRHWPNVGSLLGKRRRRWPNNELTLGQCLVFAGCLVPMLANVLSLQTRGNDVPMLTQRRRRWTNTDTSVECLVFVGLFSCNKYLTIFQRTWELHPMVTSVSVSVYYVAVRTIVLSRHGSNLARPVIIHDIIHSLIYVPSTPYCGFFGVSPDGNCAYVYWGSFTSNSKSVRRAIWFTWFSEPHDSVYGTWQSKAVTHPLMNRARRRLTSVIEQISMSERRIPYIHPIGLYCEHIQLVLLQIQKFCSF